MPTKAELEAKLNEERQHHAAQNLDTHAARFEEGELLIRCARDWADDPDNWDIENEYRPFRAIRLAAERVIEKRLARR